MGIEFCVPGSCYVKVRLALSLDCIKFAAKLFSVSCAAIRASGDGLPLGQPRLSDSLRIRQF